MNNAKRQPDSLEEMIAQFHEAEQAGVFKRTPIDMAALNRGNRPSTSPRWTHRVHGGLKIAACIGIVVGATAFWPRSEQPGRSLSNDSNEISNSILANAGRTIRVARFAECFAGPESESGGESCASADADGDGDVDLADYGALQLHARAD